MATPIPKNRAAFSLAEIVLATRGDVVVRGTGVLHGDGRSIGVSTDSRAVEPGEVFVALHGEHFDGHAHARAASERGASVLIVSRPVEVEATRTSVVCVADTLVALGDLARAARTRWARARARITGDETSMLVGITGSAGKTSTRGAASDVLAALGAEVHASAGNLNNAIGVPMTLFGLQPQHRFAVVEIGMNQPGEIARACEVALPDAGVLTLVADAHTAGVGSIWGVLREKSELFAQLPGAGFAIANADDDLARSGLVRAERARHVLYGEAVDADVRLVERHALGLSGSALRIELTAPGGHMTTLNATIPLLGRAGVLAALAATAVAVSIHPEGARSASALERALGAIGKGEPGRLAPRERADGTIVIDDAYNANPASMISSIEAAREIATKLERRLVLVLGAMFELGLQSDGLHEQVGECAARAAPATIVVVGTVAEPLARSASRAGAEVHRAVDAEVCAPLALGLVSPGDVVLVKASNSVGLSRVAERLLSE